MSSLPLHPAIVHLPLGLAVVLPLVAIGLAIALWRAWLPARAWSIVVVLQAVLLGAGFLALNTGERDEDRAEKAVSEAAIESHEEAAHRFMIGAGITLAVAAAGLFIRKEGVRRAATWATAAGTFAVAGLGFAVGKAGGSLVYEKGAANAYIASAASPGGEAGPAALDGNEGGSKGGDNDGDDD